MCLSQLPAAWAALANAGQHGAAEESAPGSAAAAALLVKWLVLCMGKLWQGAPEIVAAAVREQASFGTDLAH